MIAKLVRDSVGRPGQKLYPHTAPCHTSQYPEHLFIPLTSIATYIEVIVVFFVSPDTHQTSLAVR